MVANNSTVLTDHPPHSPSAGSRFHINGVVGLLIAFFIVAIVAVQWQRTRMMNKLIESAAIQAAKMQVDALTAIRTVYSDNVVNVVSPHGIEVTHDYDKNDHAIPLPATLTFLIADRIGIANGGGRARLYSPYPFKWREAEGGLRDEFQKQAWEKLNADPDTPVYGIVETANGPGLRYAVADRMQASCIQCHNEHPDTPRHGWKVGDVRGVLEIELPLAHIQASARQNLLGSSLLMGCLALVGGAIILANVIRFNRVTAERDQFVQQLRASNATLDQAVNERTAKLRAVEERFELAVRGSTDGLWDWNVVTNEVFYSPRFKELVGYADDEFPNVFESFESKLHPDDHDRIIAALDEHLKSHKPYDVQYRLLAKSGDYCWFRARGQAIWDDDGTATRMAGSITDVTEEHRLRKRFRLAVEASPVALLMANRDGRILMLNSRCLSLFGYAEAELIGKATEVLVPLRLRRKHPARRERLFSAPEQTGMRTDIELLAARKDGTEFPVRVGLKHIETAEGQAVICGILDITDQKQALEAMRQAKEAAESSSRAKSSFLANMSHEIRTPMNGIIGMSQLLAQTELRSNQREYLQTVDESAHVLLRLLNDILDLSKIEAGKLELERVPFRLSECVVRASQMVSLRAAEKGLEVACRVAPEIPDHLMGDPGRLQQVLVNLLGNAVKFTEAGEIYVNVAAESISSDSVRLQFSVRDTGIGIAPDKLEQIFSPFEQAESSTTRRFGGTGLGLTISRQLVEMMHGRMWLESEVGQGSTFRFTAEFDVSTTQQAYPPAELRSLQDLSVLVVDDNSTNRRILNELLQYWHMRPVLVESAAAARTAIASAAESQQPIHLILLDHHMPGEDGFQLADSLQRSGQVACPIIMISSGSVPVDPELCERHGIGRFMKKPVIASELLDEVLRQFGQSTREMPQPPKLEQRAAVIPRQILLVEDNEVNRRVALGLLQSRGHHVEVAENGQIAVETLAVKEFDVVLMDMQMPVMDGYEATKVVRAREQKSGGHIPIVAMTAEVLKGDRERCLEAGMDDYVSKPISPEQMYRAIEQFPAVCARSTAMQQSDTPRNSDSQRTSDSQSIPAAPQEPIAADGLQPAVNWTVAKQSVPGDADLLKELVDLVKTELPVYLAEIRQAIEVRDAKSLHRTAHTMKSSVGYVGAATLVQLAQRLENCGKSEAFEGIDELLTAAEQEAARVLLELEKFKT